MRAIVWSNPDKMSIDTGCKTFDRQTNIVSTGNIIANTQAAFYIRGELNCTCWGGDRPPGHLRNFDFGNFRGLPGYIRDRIILHTNGTDRSVWVSKFFHFSRERQIVHGYIITTPDHKLLEKFVTGPTYKSELVIEGVLPYVVENNVAEENTVKEDEE